MTKTIQTRVGMAMTKTSTSNKGRDGNDKNKHTSRNDSINRKLSHA